ncbi:unnamed protein product [Alternaria alternata]
MSSDHTFGKDPNRRLNVYNACYTVQYPRGHDKNDSRQYAPGLRLEDIRAPQTRFQSADHDYILQDACPGTQGYLLRKLSPEIIDYEILRCWLRYCKRHHTGCTQIYDCFIPGLKVIDCTTGNVIEAPEDEAFLYVALSYVWGGAQSSGTHHGKFPGTICDAITVTVQLGYRYLWVDQYCINQLAAGHKQAQIQLMGRIYAEAELVIIAAAGDSSNYGLPGVGIKARKAQRETRLENDVTIIEVNEPNHEIHTSTWAQRGWTHQEGYLATRRLVFTDKEVLYVCNQGAWQESVQRPSIEDDVGYLNTFTLNMFTQCFPEPNPASYNDRGTVYRILDNYSGRKLSYDSDILNACIGVLNKLVSHHHFWGMVTPRLDFKRYMPLCLAWRSRVPGPRREGFPSWSWVATASPKSIYPCDWGDHHGGYDAHIRTNDGRWLSPEEQTESRCDPLPMNFGPTLRLRAMLYTAFLSTHTKNAATGIPDTGPDNQPVVVFESTDGNGSEMEIVFKLWLDAELLESDLKNGIKAVLASGSTKEDRNAKSYPDGPVFMILQTVGDRYKRIGITDHEFDCWTQEKRTGTMKKRDRFDILSYDACRGSEETIFIE